MRLSKWYWLVGIPLLSVVIFTIYWGYQYLSHSTPQKALDTYHSGVSFLETVKFADGFVLITPSNESNSFTAWYMTKDFWGWHVRGVSDAVAQLSPQNYNVDFELFVYGGQTFVWGTSMLPMKEIIYRHDGKIFTAKIGKYPVWHMILPFPQSYFPHSNWTMVLPNGSTVPLFKS